MIKILITGSNGQLGRCLQDTAPETRKDFDVLFLSRDELDLNQESQIEPCIQNYQPDYIINCAAYTAVDKAETEKDLTFKVNADAVKAVARISSNISARLIHISTDFVFDGKGSKPYSPDASVHPLGVYGESKLAGENEIIKTYPDGAMIIRTAWVYSEYGNNFVKTMLRLMKEKPLLNVVHDQIGSPTYAGRLAEVIWSIIMHDKFEPGIYHWTDRGEISWYDFACAIQEEAIDLNLLKNSIPVHPISSSEYPTPARRPAYSVLDCSKLQQLIGQEGTDWRKNLREMLVRYSNMPS